VCGTMLTHRCIAAPKTADCMLPCEKAEPNLHTCHPTPDQEWSGDANNRHYTAPAAKTLPSPSSTRKDSAWCASALAHKPTPSTNTRRSNQTRLFPASCVLAVLQHSSHSIRQLQPSTGVHLIGTGG
jgi:hypothetical protein